MPLTREKQDMASRGCLADGKIPFLARNDAFAVLGEVFSSL
jgi:hypothetical protein